MTDPQFTELTTKYIDTVYRLALTRMKNMPKPRTSPKRCS